MSTTPQAGEPTMEEILASIRRIISEEGEAPKEAEPAQDDVFELTKLAAEPAPAVAAERPRPSLVAPPDELTFAPRDPEPAPSYDSETLVSPGTAARASNHFDVLERHIQMAETPLGGSLEGLVRDMLRPLLKGWVETHLPVIVERIVREEVERLASRKR